MKKTIKEKIINKIEWYRRRFYVKRLSYKTIKKINAQTCNSRIYYFLTPTHSNLGDQAQLMCWLKLFAKWYPNYEIIQIPLVVGNSNVFDSISKHINSNDKIFIHSGYLVCDLYNNWQMICKVINTFSQLPITILPQTIHFLNPNIQEKVAACFNQHGNIHLVCRDNVSYSKAEKIFPDLRLSLMPDVVTSLIGTNYIKESNKREGVLLCVRHDAEKLYSDKEFYELKKRLNGLKVDISDTSTRAKIWEWNCNRESIIANYLYYFSKYQVIVTDRYHGTIFSQIVNTPVVVLSSNDHKLKSGVDWFPKELFSDNIMFAGNLQEAYEMVLAVIGRHGKIIDNPPYFLNTFYTKSL